MLEHITAKLNEEDTARLDAIYRASRHQLGQRHSAEKTGKHSYVVLILLKFSMPRGKNKTESPSTDEPSNALADMQRIAEEVFDAKKEKLKTEIEDECEYEVYIQSVEIEKTFEKLKEKLKRRAETFDVKKLIQEQCMETINTFVKSLQEDMDALKSENMEIKKETKSLMEENGKMKKENRQLKKILEKLEFEMTSKNEETEELKIKVDEIEQQQLEKNLRIVGLPDEPNGVSDFDKFQKLARKELNIKVDQTDIMEIYRVGRTSEKKKHRDTIIKFRKKTTRDNIHQQRKNMVPKEEQESRVYINDHLTDHRANIFFALRKLVKDKRIHSAWSQRGNILMKSSETDRPIQITSHRQVRELTHTSHEFEVNLNTGADSSDEED